MAPAFVYHFINIILLVGIGFLLVLLYERLEIVENRALFVATLGVCVDLLAWYAISFMTTLDGAIFGLRLSIIGRALFGAGFISYISQRYKSKFSKYIRIVWGFSCLILFIHSLKLPTGSAYLKDLTLVSISGITVLKGVRGFIYFFNASSVMMLGIWSTLLIFTTFVKRKGAIDDIVLMNDFFYLVSIVLMGLFYTVYELRYDSLPNYSPVFKALATAIYAILAFKFNFLDFDNLARESLMNDMGAGFIVLSTKKEPLYANDVAREIFPSLEEGSFTKTVAESAINKREYQFEKNGRFYKVTTDRILTNGKLDGYTMLIVDVSDIVQLQNRATFSEETRKTLLTNISHELRTPLNAIIGASEMMESEDASKETYKECTEIIRVASMNMDDMLGDILTAAREYEEVKTAEKIPYSVCTLIDSVLELSRMRMYRKKVSVEVDLADDIPINAYGDDKNLRQVLLNVITGALRYTDDGAVRFEISGEYIDDEHFEYRYIIQDTGRMINRLGESSEVFFDGADEFGLDYSYGIGVGFMVSKKIAQSFGGDLTIRSISGKGNIYTLTIPSEIVDRKTMRSLSLSNKISVHFLGDNQEMYGGVIRSCRRLEISGEMIPNISHIRKLSDTDGICSLLVFDYEKNGRKIAISEKAKDYVKVAVLKSDKLPSEAHPDFIYVHSPVSIISLYKAYQEYIQRDRVNDIKEAQFVAPKAKALVVDDNSINLEMARNMLESFKVNVDICESGYGCLELLRSGRDYDIIFMDYMMEGMDGVETTKKIRKMDSSICDVPIVAYTANAVEGAKDMYIEAGMNGCIFKPATKHAFSNALRDYLPRSYLVYDDESHNDSMNFSNDAFPSIEGVDRATAIKYSGGNRKLYFEMVSAFLESVDSNELKLLDNERTGDYKGLSITAHAIKGLSRTLGLLQLSEIMANIEKAGAEENAEYIKKNLQRALSMYRRTKILLLPYISEDKKEKPLREPKGKAEEVLSKMQAFLEDFETDKAEELFAEIWPGDYDEKISILMEGLKESIENGDYYASKDFVDNLLKTYEE